MTRGRKLSLACGTRHGSAHRPFPLLSRRPPRGARKHEGACTFRLRPRRRSSPVRAKTAPRIGGKGAGSGRTAPSARPERSEGDAPPSSNEWARGSLRPDLNEVGERCWQPQITHGHQCIVVVRRGMSCSHPAGQVPSVPTEKLQVRVSWPTFFVLIWSSALKRVLA